MVEMTVTSRADPSSNWEGRCRLLPTLNYLTFNLEPRRKKGLLQSDWTDTRSIRRNRSRVYSECRDTQNERQEHSSIKCVHKLMLITLAPASYCEPALTLLTSLPALRPQVPCCITSRALAKPQGSYGRKFWRRLNVAKWPGMCIFNPRRACAGGLR